MEISKQAHLSGLGRMGQRHLSALVEEGYQVVAFDPRSPVLRKGDRFVELEEQGAITWDSEFSNKIFDVAIFSETAPYRFGNLIRFLSQSRAKRVLLEKPLTSKHAELKKYLGMDSALANRAFVNYSFRTWPFYRRVRDLCRESFEIRMVVNGGNRGLGCNGPHYLDLFVYLTEDQNNSVRYADLSGPMIPSPRGPQFKDYGGQCVVENDRGSLYLSFSPLSEIRSSVSIVGDGFKATLDEYDYQYRTEELRPGVPKSFGTLDGGTFVPPSFESITRDWLRGESDLPSLREAFESHRILFEILKKGGAKGPYLFT